MYLYYIEVTLAPPTLSDPTPSHQHPTFSQVPFLLLFLLTLFCSVSLTRAAHMGLGVELSTDALESTFPSFSLALAISS